MSTYWILYSQEKVWKNNSNNFCSRHIKKNQTFSFLTKMSFLAGNLKPGLLFFTFEGLLEKKGI